MKTGKLSGIQICNILRKQEAGVEVAETCRAHGISLEQMKPPSE